jgi:fumarate hydratase class II
MSQSTNDSFPSAMCIAAAKAAKELLIPSLDELRDALAAKAGEWGDIVKVGRTHLQDATPMTLGQEFSGYAAMVDDGARRVEQALEEVYALTLGGTAIGTGVNAAPGFAEAATARIAELSGLPFTPVSNRFAAQGSHDSLVHLSAALKTLAGALFKISNDIRLLACGPRCGIGELMLPANEPGSSIMPGKVNPTQCEVLAMIAVQAMANDTAVALGGASGYLEMNVYKPLMIRNLLHSIGLLADGCRGFRMHLVEGMVPDRKRIESYVERCLMLVTALNPVIGYDNAAKTAHDALENDLSLKEAAVRLGVVTAEEFDRIVDPRRMTGLDEPPGAAD